jgi:carbon storage regulator
VLIITRRPGEKIMVGDEVTIHVMEILGNQVRLGIHAPKSIPVYREEIWEAARAEDAADAAAARSSPPD